MPRVSVIIPCYNQGMYIDEAVDSVLNQTYQDLEIIVVNDGSVDEQTKQLLSNYERPKTKVIHTTNQGLATSRNNGIRIATGEFILPLDADDKIGRQYVEEAVALFDKDPDLGIVYCMAEYFGAKKGIWALPPYSLEGLLLENMIFNAALFRKKDWEAVNGYNPNMKYCYEDWDFWLSLVELGRKVYRIPKVLFYYRITHASMIRKSTDDQMIDMRVQLFRNHEELYLNSIRSNPRPFVAGWFQANVTLQKMITSRTWKWTKPARKLASCFRTR